MGVPHHVLEWLSAQVNAHYGGDGRVYAETAHILGSLPSLKPSTAVYTSSNGIPELLLRIAGPLPAHVGGATYGIPIEIWIPTSFPVKPPIIYVRPTEQMVVDPSPIVDRSGLVSFNWNVQSDSLLNVALMLSEQFSIHCPVYAVEPPPPASSHIPLQAHLPEESTAGSSGLGQVPPPQYVRTEGVQSTVASLSAQTGALSLLESEQVQPPPLPANPRKADAVAAVEQALEQAKSRVLAQKQHDLGNMASIADHLKRHLRAIAAEEKALASAIQKCKDNSRLLSSRASEARSLARRATEMSLSEEQPVAAEDRVVASTESSAKLVELIATDHALEDIQAALASALDREKLDVDTFLKHVRTTAREQFGVRHAALEVSRKAVFGV